VEEVLQLHQVPVGQEAVQLVQKQLELPAAVVLQEKEMLVEIAKRVAEATTQLLALEVVAQGPQELMVAV
jgi:hypothetical protein